MATINDLLAGLKTAVDALTFTGFTPTVYAARVLPETADESISITHMGGLPATAVTGGAAYSSDDFSLALFVRHDNTTASLTTAEQSLNHMEQVLRDGLIGSKPSGLWRKLEMVTRSSKPPSPRELVNTRYGVVYVRLHY